MGKKEAPLKIVADENIPLLAELFAHWGDVVLMPGRKIQRQDLVDTDILLIRSVTQVDQPLLQDTGVKFVGTATTGTEHIDIDWLAQHKIAFASAKGSNAEAVADYVVACLAALYKKQTLSKKTRRAGIIGVGNVGSKVAAKLQLLGFDVLQNDPPRAATDSTFTSTPLSKFFDLDLICLHTPLTKHSLHPTYHLINERFLKNLKPGCVLLNAGRGAVIDFVALEKYSKNLTLCLDVWEHEPHINLEILSQALIATPHIAGYSVEAKLQGAFILYEKACAFFQKPAIFSDHDSFSSKVNLMIQSPHWEDIILQIYDPLQDTIQMQRDLLVAKNVAHNFDILRKHYPRRHEFKSVFLQNKAILPTAEWHLLQQLGLK